MDNSAVLPVSGWERLKLAFKRALPHRRKKEQPRFESYSKFKAFVMDMDPGDEMYEPVTYAATLCDEALIVARQRISLVNKIQELNESLSDLHCYSRLSDADAHQLKDLLERFISLNKDRNILRYQLTDFDSSLTKMSGMEQEARSALPQMKDSETHQRILRNDLGYLQGEKSDLEYEHQMLQNGLDFINKFGVAMVVVFTSVCIVLAYLYIFNHSAIFFPMSLLVLSIMAVVTLLYLFRRRLTYELEVNRKKQLRAIEMLNKKSVVYAYYTNFLKYEYGKYKVKSAQMLETNLKDYHNYQHVTNRVDSIRKIMYETEAAIDTFLRDKNIAVHTSLEKFARTVNIDDKKRYHNELSEEKRAIEVNLASLDAKHERIWDLLTELNEKDKSAEGIIDKIIQTYLAEANRTLIS